MGIPDFVCKIDNKLYCCLQGELDKEHFEDQCKKCSIHKQCKIIQDMYKNVPGDWHALNASGFYGAEFDNCTDKYRRKEIRGISKGCGLALTYGGTSYTLSENMGCTPEEAQVKIDNFFRKLPDLSAYIKRTISDVLKTGKVWNAFGRMRDVSKWSHSKADNYKQRGKDKGFAQRTALNHPIQSFSGDILKVGMIRVDQRIIRDHLNPVYGLAVPQELDLSKISYKDIIAAQLSSVHDELIHMFNEEYMDDQISRTYEVMQIKDVIDKFGMGFDLECDCEFDPWRSWTAKNNYPASKVFLINKLRKGGQDLDVKNLSSNTIIMELKDINPKFLETLAKMNPDQYDSSMVLYYLAVSDGERIFLNNTKYPIDFVNSLGISYKQAYISV